MGNGPPYLVLFCHHFRCHSVTLTTCRRQKIRSLTLFYPAVPVFLHPCGIQVKSSLSEKSNNYDGLSLKWKGPFPKTRLRCPQCRLLPDQNISTILAIRYTVVWSIAEIVRGKRLIIRQYNDRGPVRPRSHLLSGRIRKRRRFPAASKHVSSSYHANAPDGQLYFRDKSIRSRSDTSFHNVWVGLTQKQAFRISHVLTLVESTGILGEKVRLQR